MAIAAGLRFWDLGTMALHHDESLHTQYTWYLYEGRGYQHNPLMHGPFLFHSGALVYFLFGDSEMTARFLPALFGTILVGMPYLLRKQIGMPAVIIAAVLLAVSPTLLYYSRFYRNEAYMAVWTLGIVICIWRYLDEGKSLYLYVMAALMALSFATKEVTFITVAIMLLFVNLMLAVELAKRRPEEEVSEVRVLLRTLTIAPFAWLIAALWPLIGKKPFGLERLPPIGDIMIVLGTLSLPQFAAGIQVLPFVENYGYDVAAENSLRVGTVLTLLVASAYVGLLWRPQVFILVAAAFFLPYVLLYTTFFTNIDGFFSGIWGSLDYWLDQHHVKRGDQPLYYYGLMTPLYEFLPLVLGMAGSVWLLLRGDSLGRWLLFWLFGIFAGLSLAGEKMPWLEVHIALPLILVAALALAKAFDALDLYGRRWLTAAALAVVSAVMVLLLVEGGGTVRLLGVLLAAAVLAWLAAALLRDRDGLSLAGLAGTLARADLQLTLGLLAVAALAVGGVGLVGAFGVEAFAAVWLVALLPVALAGYLLAYLMGASRAFGRGLLVVSVACLLTLTVRAGVVASFDNRDTPVEMMVYTQTSRDIPNLRDRIEAVAARSGLGYNLPIVVDTADSFAWPWAWYLRNYHQLSFINVTANYSPPPGTVLLVSRSNANLIDPGLYSAHPYKHRWWFEETYRDLTFRSAASVLTSKDGLASLLDFFLYRRDAETTTGSVNGVAFIPNDLAGLEQEQGSALPAREPVRLADGRIVLGSGSGLTSAPGAFVQPADLFVDAQGNIWVADSGNSRIQKFDAQGNYLGSLGRRGSGPGQLNEPWSVAVDAQGFIYVADTWNHRIQKYAPDFSFVSGWGTPSSRPDAGPLDFFGPRDIVITADGSLWVTDTGNRRLLKFAPDGRPLDVLGRSGSGPSEFAEPVGLALDRAGNMYVADAWNGRVQRLSPGSSAAVSFEVSWTSREVLDKPYITVLSSGQVLVSKPENGRLILFDAQGNRVGEWQPLADGVAVGVAALPDGGFVFSDIRRNEVQIVPGNLLQTLFR